MPLYSVVVNIMKFYRHDRDSNPIAAAKIKHANHYTIGPLKKAKVVLLHTSTNDLDDEQISWYITEIYRLLNGRGIKFVWSNIVPRSDHFLNVKTELINAKVGVSLWGKDGVYISRNYNFYMRDMINAAFFAEDGIHVYDQGIKQLARNTRSALYRSLNIEFASTKPGRKYGKGRTRWMFILSRRDIWCSCKIP